ncbi:NaeI family type II restriction endonuclease [Streptomyces sp. NPDC059994]|uniref:NaeI family type II restriction endonuclease n=1 Tax=Streptomyces sp. NPDC059994 TaxID=3347029 RepID=UPI0036AAD932
MDAHDPDRPASPADLTSLHAPDSPDVALREVADWFRAFPGMEATFGACIRQGIDEVLDGARTGRYDITDKDTVESTEKTYLGTKMEILIRSAFGLARGKKMDFLVDGHEVDAKWTIRKNWTIPVEAKGHICLLMSADDHAATFRVGLVRIGAESINPGKNRDAKSGLSRTGRDGIEWLVSEGSLPKNLLLHLPESARAKILLHTSGQGRVNALFLHALRRKINRRVIQTLAQQEDYMARIRDDKGNSRARSALRRQGIIILGGALRRHKEIALGLGGPVPERDEFVSFCIAKQQPEHDLLPSVELDGASWIAVDDPKAAPDPAPKIPTK